MSDCFLRFIVAASVNMPQAQKIPIPSLKRDENSNILGVHAIARLLALYSKHLTFSPEDLSQFSEDVLQLKEEYSEKSASQLASEINGVVAAAYTVSTEGKFNRNHLEYIMDNHFPGVFDSSKISEYQEVDEDSEEGADVGKPYELSRRVILETYDEFIRKSNNLAEAV